MRLRCPTCSMEILAEPGTHPICPRCGYRGPAPLGDVHAPPMSAPRQAPAPPYTSGPYGAPAGQYYPPQNPPTGHGYPGQQPAPQARTSGLAVASLVVALAGLITGPFAIITAIVAIILGTLGQREISQSQGAVRGQPYAAAGIIIGIIQLALAVLFLMIIGIFSSGGEWYFY